MSTIIITTTQYVFALRGDSIHIVHEGKGVYYGIACSENELYVGCRNEIMGPVDASARETERGSILVFEQQSLSLIREIKPDQFSLRDIHGMLYVDRKLFVTCSFDNMIAIYDFASNCWSKWYPAINPLARGRDQNHFNSLIVDEENIVVLAHNHGRSTLFLFDRESLELCSTRMLGVQAHDIFRILGNVATCSSAEGTIVSEDGWVLRTGGFPRGIDYAGESIFVGISHVTKREQRHDAPGIIRQFDRAWKFKADYLLYGVGMVLAIKSFEGSEINMSQLKSFENYIKFDYEYNNLSPGNAYDPGSNGVRAGVEEQEWHSGEDTHRWTAAREARMSIVINAGEKHLKVFARSDYPGKYFVKVYLNTEYLGNFLYDHADNQTAVFLLPRDVRGKCDLTFTVPHLWRPSTCFVGNTDERFLGIAIRRVEIE
jgi:hypothetical protein